jgi:hypothetical protein
LISPSNRGKEPAYLLQKRGILHVTPGVASTLDWEFSEPQMTYDIIEDESVIKISSWSISIIRGSIEVEIPNKQPKIIVPNVQVVQPINKNVPGRLPAGAINYNKSPGLKVM